MNPKHWREAVQLLTSLTYLLDGLDGERLAEDVIRFLSFSALGMTHTCCRPSRRYNSAIFNLYGYCEAISVLDPAEVEEIRDEEAGLIERLDCLVNSFMEDFRELGLPLSQFLLEKWQITVLEELEREENITELVREQLEEIGVTMHSESSSEG